MTDFAGLIERAIERDTRERFVEFLGGYEHVELGRSRALTVEEAAMVLACTDRFALDIGVIDLGVVEITRLRSRLERLTHPKLERAPDSAIANTCFDAIACISALEARLRRCLRRSEVLRMHWSARASTVANDS